jgi:type I restriction enzyme M protein
MFLQELQTTRVEDEMAKRKTADNGSQRLLIKELRSPKQVFRNLRNYLAGQFVGATRDDALLDEVLKCLFCRLYLETSRVDEPLESAHDAFATAEFYRGVFGSVRNDFPEIYDPTTEMLLDPKSLLHVVDSIDFTLVDAKSDPIGDAFEVFAGSESRGRNGQFFTPNNATELLVNAVAPKPAESVIDPACGAGGFLASVVRYYRALGLKDSDMPAAVGNVWGIEKDAYLTKLARLHVSLLSGSHPHVLCGDSLAMRNEIEQPITLPSDGFDVVLTNPPFGVKIVAAKADVLRQFELGAKWRFNKENEQWHSTDEAVSTVPPQVLFVEQCLNLARPRGRLGLVLPESILSNKSYRHVVEFLRRKASVDAVIGMPESLFKTSGKGGTHTKTCLLVLTKIGAPSEQRGKVFMAEAKWCGKDSRAREIPNDDLPVIGANLEFFRRGKRLTPSRLGFVIEDEKLSENVLCPRYHDPELESEIDALQSTHELVKFGDLLTKRCLHLSTGDEVGKLAYGGGDVPFVRTSDVSNWEIKLDPKHTLERTLYEALREKQDVRPHDILMVKDGTYLIGTCAMVTSYDCEMVYQSHIYKIRVLKEAHGLNPFLLLAILSCSVVQRQIKAKQFTQDIIDSLGERIRELVLPIPRSEDSRREITEMVKRVIDERVEARELARKAVIAVLN